MVSKKILGVAIAAAFSSQAFAVVDLESSTPAKVAFAKETFLTGDKTTVSSVDYYTVTGAGNILDVTAKMGVGMNNAQKLFVRVDAANALFLTAPSLATATATSTIAQGGAGSGYVVFEVTASASKPQSDVVTITVADLKLKSGFAGTGYTFTVYETLTSAVNSGTSLYSKSLADAVTVKNALSTTFTKVDKVADVSADFLKFTGASTFESVGKIKYVVDTALKTKAGGAIATLADVTTIATANDVQVTVAGDLSIGGMYYRAYTSGPTTTGISATTGKVDAVTAAAVTAGTDYDVFLGVNGTSQVINPTTFSATVKYVGLASAAFPPADATGTLGSITKNGTTVQVPYLTTFSDYNQRLVLVNRGSKDATYKVTFTPEAAVTAAAGTAATGTVAAGKTLVLKAVDLVTLTGGTRTAATVNLSAVTGNIDAATTSVNLSDKSTDTVKLQ